MCALIKKFNSLGYNKSILHLKEIPYLGTIKIVGAKMTKTPFGDIVLLETDDHVIFLPKRYSAMTEDDIEELGSGKYQLVKDSTDDNPISIKIKNLESS